MIAFALLALSLLMPRCTTHGRLPDRACSPGAVATTDLAVVCGQSTRLRRHVSEATKRAVLAEYGIAWADRASVEVDHLVPLACGGANAIENLWPEPIADAKIKDAAEDRAHAAVCSGRMRLEDAQAAFERDWTELLTVEAKR